MSRFNAILLLFFASLASPAFSADAATGTTMAAPGEDIDPATGLARSTVVRPLSDAPPVPGIASAAKRVPAARAHIALILPTASPSLGSLAEALRQGFAAAAQENARDTLPVILSAVDNESSAPIEACRAAHAAGAVVVVGGLTRDGALALAASDCANRPLLALNELRADVPGEVYSVSLSLDQEARQAALLAVGEDLHQAIVIGTASPLSRRVQDAFEREWLRAAGESRRIVFSGNPEDAPQVREKLTSTRGDIVFLALDPVEARAVRPYIFPTLPVYATSMSVNPRSEAIVNLDLQGLRYGEMPWFIQPDHPAVMVYPQPKAPLSVDQERLYALGIDAYRLAQALARGPLKEYTLDGVTGRIVLEPGRVFTRHLPAAEIDGGRVIPLRAP